MGTTRFATFFGPPFIGGPIAPYLVSIVVWGSGWTWATATPLISAWGGGEGVGAVVDVGTSRLSCGAVGCLVSALASRVAALRRESALASSVSNSLRPDPGAARVGVGGHGEPVLGAGVGPATFSGQGEGHVVVGLGDTCTRLLEFRHGLRVAIRMGQDQAQVVVQLGDPRDAARSPGAGSSRHRPAPPLEVEAIPPGRNRCRGCPGRPRGPGGRVRRTRGIPLRSWRIASRW